MHAAAADEALPVPAVEHGRAHAEATGCVEVTAEVTEKVTAEVTVAAFVARQHGFASVAMLLQRMIARTHCAACSCALVLPDGVQSPPVALPPLLPPSELVPCGVACPLPEHHDQALEMKQQRYWALQLSQREAQPTGCRSGAHRADQAADLSRGYFQSAGCELGVAKQNSLPLMQLVEKVSPTPRPLPPAETFSVSCAAAGLRAPENAWKG